MILESSRECAKGRYLPCYPMGKLVCPVEASLCEMIVNRYCSGQTTLFIVDLKTPWLIHANLNTINGLEMNSSSWNNYTIISGLTGAISVDYHFTQRCLYWTDQLTHRITR
jgi:hypothetical protein